MWTKKIGYRKFGLNMHCFMSMLHILFNSWLLNFTRLAWHGSINLFKIGTMFDTKFHRVKDMIFDLTVEYGFQSCKYKYQCYLVSLNINGILYSWENPCFITVSMGCIYLLFNTTSMYFSSYMYGPSQTTSSIWKRKHWGTTRKWR